MDLQAQMADLARALAAGVDTFAVHYSCESFYEPIDHPPAVSTISVARVGARDVTSFARIDYQDAAVAERGVLDRFYAWLRERPDARIVHWNMANQDFGFGALANRYTFVAAGAIAPQHADARLFDLDELIAGRHGEGYVSHPRLSTLVAMNGLETRYTMSGPEQGQAFREGRHADLARCTSERAATIAQLTSLFADGRLQTGRSGPALRWGGVLIDSVETVLALGSRIRDAADVLRRRRQGKPAISLDDEYDYQDMVHVALRLFFDDVRPEDAVPIRGGAASRIDFILPTHSIAVELKATRDSLVDGKLGEQLIVDRERYRARADVRHLICLVYDSERVLVNPAGLESDLSQDEGGELAVTVKIYR